VRQLVWLAAALLLVGCERPDRAAGGARNDAAVADRIATAHLHRHLTQSPNSLDPSFSADMPAYAVVDDLFEGLVRLDAAGNIVPGVAERWESSTDGLQWRFHLRPQARWSNGQALTAADFVFSWRRMLDPQTGSRNANELRPIAGAAGILDQAAALDTLGVTAPDALTLEVRLATPTPYFLYLLTNSWLMPLHEPTLREHGNRWTDAVRMVSNGPFILKSTAINGPIALLRNPRYWNAAAVHLAAVTYFPITDTAAATARFLAGDLDITDRFQVDDIPWLQRSLGSQLRMEPQFGTFMLAMQVDRPPFNDIRLRQALVLALDREIIAGKLLKGLYSPAYGIVPPLPGYAAVLPEWSRWPDAARHREAQRLYAAAGYSRQRPLDVELWYASTDADTRRILEAAVAMWRMNLGATVRLANEEQRVLQQNRAIGKHRLFFYSWIGDYPDPISFLGLLAPGSLQNSMRYHSAAYAQALQTGARGSESAMRHAAYNEAERILNADAVMVPVYYYRSRHLLRAQVHGWQGNPMDRHASRDFSLAAPRGP
jgi:oligopeptide transport system substrate-binding protein